jgi:hypothetical protein
MKHDECLFLDQTFYLSLINAQIDMHYFESTCSVIYTSILTERESDVGHLTGHIPRQSGHHQFPRALKIN